MVLVNCRGAIYADLVSKMHQNKNSAQNMQNTGHLTHPFNAQTANHAAACWFEPTER